MAVLVAALVAASVLLGGLFAHPSLAADPNGNSTAAHGQTSSDEHVAPAQQRVENMIAAARQYLGVPYRVGGAGPSLFDCSGLVFRAFSDAGLADRIGGARLRAAGYMRWFAAHGLMTSDESQAQRGDLVVYNNGSHIGIYLGDGRVLSALTSGVTAHSLHALSLPVTGFLRPDWSGDGKVPPFVPVSLPDVPETPVTLVPTADWMPTFDAGVTAPAQREGKERPDMRTLDSRTFENADGTFTTEFHAQPIFYQPAGTTRPDQLNPVDLRFSTTTKSADPTVTQSPVVVTTRPADDAQGFVSAWAADTSVSLSLAQNNAISPSSSVPQIVSSGRVVDFFDFQPQAVGLRVLAQTDGFKSFLVMGKEPTRLKFSFDLNAPGLTPTLEADGSITLTDANGAIRGRMPRPLLLDSSDRDGSGGGLLAGGANLTVSSPAAASSADSLPVITLSVDRAHLDEAVFPAYVDLSLTEFPEQSPGADVGFASSAHPNTALHGYQRPESAGFDELWLGHQPSSHNDNDVYLRFGGLVPAVGTVDVASASLELLPYAQRSNDGVTVAHEITSAWTADTLTWADKPSASTTELAPLKTTAGTWSTIDVSTYVTDVLSRGLPDYGLMLAGTEGASGSWKRLAASDDGEQAQFGPRLVVTWSGLRPTATEAPGTATAATGTAPTLTWTNPELASEQTRFQVEVSHDGFATTDATSGTVKGANGSLDQWTVPPGSLTVANTYEWRVRAQFGTQKTWSEWSTPHSFDFRGASQATPHGAV